MSFIPPCISILVALATEFLWIPLLEAGDSHSYSLGGQTWHQHHRNLGPRGPGFARQVALADFRQCAEEAVELGLGGEPLEP